MSEAKHVRGGTGGFFCHAEEISGVDLAEAARRLTTGSAWRRVGPTDGDKVTLRQGSRVWLRLMGAWEWGGKARKKWPFIAELESKPDERVLIVTVKDCRRHSKTERFRRSKSERFQSRDSCSALMLGRVSTPRSRRR